MAGTAHPVFSALFIGVSCETSFEEKAPLLERFENPFADQMSRMKPRVVQSHTATQRRDLNLDLLTHSLVPFLSFQGLFSHLIRAEH